MLKVQLRSFHMCLVDFDSTTNLAYTLWMHISHGKQYARALYQYGCSKGTYLSRIGTRFPARQVSFFHTIVYKCVLISAIKSIKKKKYCSTQKRRLKQAFLGMEIYNAMRAISLMAWRDLPTPLQSTTKSATFGVGTYFLVFPLLA